MTHDDLLARATGALRDSAVPSADDGALTLARVQKSLRGGASRPGALRRRIARFVLLPIAAVLVATGAWAGATGRFATLLARRDGQEAEREPHAHLAASPAAAPRAPAALPPPVERLDPEPALAPPPPAPTPTPTPTPTLAASVVPSRVVRAPAVDPDALYREAHDAHFARRDYGASVTAWDRYLAAAGPGGRFVLEARWNRAVALVRTGRRADAAAALRPFAAGDYGGYRRDEARELLRTLD